MRPCRRTSTRGVETGDEVCVDDQCGFDRGDDRLSPLVRFGRIDRHVGRTQPDRGEDALRGTGDADAEGRPQSAAATTDDGVAQRQEGVGSGRDGDGGREEDEAEVVGHIRSMRPARDYPPVRSGRWSGAAPGTQPQPALGGASAGATAPAPLSWAANRTSVKRSPSRVATTNRRTGSVPGAVSSGPSSDAVPPASSAV